MTVTTRYLTFGFSFLTGHKNGTWNNEEKASLNKLHTSFIDSRNKQPLLSTREEHEYGYNSNEDSYFQGNDLKWSEMGKYCTKTNLIYWQDIWHENRMNRAKTLINLLF